MATRFALLTTFAINFVSGNNVSVNGDLIMGANGSIQQSNGLDVLTFTAGTNGIIAEGNITANAGVIVSGVTTTGTLEDWYFQRCWYYYSSR